jgi:phage baseplate assembly protein W
VNGAGDRAFRFVGGGFESGGTGLAVTATGAVGMVEGDAAVRQAIILLLCTAPGERLMRPGYGSYLHRLLFAGNDRTTAGLAVHYVRSAITRWEPRVDIVDLDAGADPDVPEQLVVTLRYRVRASLTVDTIEFVIPTGGAS